MNIFRDKVTMEDLNAMLEAFPAIVPKPAALRRHLEESGGLLVPELLLWTRMEEDRRGGAAQRYGQGAGMNAFLDWDATTWRRQMEEVFDQLAENAKNEPYAQILRNHGFDPETHILVLPKAQGERRPKHLKYVRFSDVIDAPIVIRRLW